MKKIFNILIVLFFLFYAYQFVFTYFSKGHTITYDIVDGNYTVNVKEIFRNDIDVDKANYSISINAYGDEFDYLVYDDFKNQSKIVDHVKYYIDNEYSCLFVRFSNDRVLSDVICKKDNIYYPFNSISNPSEKLTDFISSLTHEGYYIKNYLNNIDESYRLDDVQVNKSNFDENHFIGLEMENSLYRITINKKNERIPLNKQEKTISTFINNYYIMSEYTENTITGFKIYNINDGENTNITANLDISSYFLGSVGNCVYVYDPVNHIEYEISPKNNTITEYGNREKGILFYKNGRWEKTTYDDFEVNNIEFDNEDYITYENENYDIIKKVGNTYGYYYTFKKSDHGYKLYRSSIENPDNLLYLFETDDIDSIKFILNGVYYRDKDMLKYYSDKKGNRTILVSNGLLSKNSYNVYLKDKKKLLEKDKN